MDPLQVNWGVPFDEHEPGPRPWGEKSNDLGSPGRTRTYNPPVNNWSRKTSRILVEF